jgi:cephalosporin-C deacetylase
VGPGGLRAPHYGHARPRHGGSLGETADPHPTAGEVAYAGLMTRGAGSQGGGIVVAVTGLASGRLDGVITALPDVLFLQDCPRAIDL